MNFPKALFMPFDQISARKLSRLGAGCWVLVSKCFVIKLINRSHWQRSDCAIYSAFTKFCLAFHTTVHNKKVKRGKYYVTNDGRTGWTFSLLMWATIRIKMSKRNGKSHKNFVEYFLITAWEQSLALKLIRRMFFVPSAFSLCFCA